MILLWEQKDQARMGEWISERTGSKYESGVYLGVENNGKIVAVCAYEFVFDIAYGHIAIDGYLPKTLLKVMFDYPFKQAGAIKIIARIEHGNEAAKRFVKKLGFRQIEDLITEQYEMLKTECKWIKE